MRLLWSLLILAACASPAPGRLVSAPTPALRIAPVVPEVIGRAPERVWVSVLCAWITLYQFPYRALRLNPICGVSA